MSAVTVTIPAQCLRLDRVEMQQLPPSAQRVCAAVMDHGPVSLPDLQHITGLPRRTVAYGIARLKEAQFVAWHQRLDDYRVRYFSIHPRLVHDGDDACKGARRDGVVIHIDSLGGLPSRQVARWLHGR